MVSSVLLASTFGRKTYLSSLFLYVNSSPSSALTYPLDHGEPSDFCRIVSSSFSASVQARSSTCPRNLFTGSCGIICGPFLSASFDFVVFCDVDYPSFGHFEVSL